VTIGPIQVALQVAGALEACGLLSQEYMWTTIEHVSPPHDGFALRNLKQAFVYLKRVNGSDTIDQVVRPALRKGAWVREQPHKVPLYVTLGSPLALRWVRMAFGKPRTVPEGLRDVPINRRGRLITDR
jgi:hypothetical protein